MTLDLARRLRDARPRYASMAALAEAHSIAPNHAANLLRMLTLPADVLALVEDGTLSHSRAIRLAGLPDAKARDIVMRDIASWSSFMSAVREARGGRASRAKTTAATLDDAVAAERGRRDARDARGHARAAFARIDALEEVVRTYERVTATPPRRVEPVVLRAGRRPAAAVALLSDVHAEERVVRTDAIDNEYDLAIAERRVGRFFAGVTWLVEHAASYEFDIATVIVWLGGDLISGDIHDELLERCEVPPGEAMLVVRDWIVAGLRAMLRDLPGVRVVVPCSVGNHGRTTKRMRAATGYGHSWEWVLYQVVAHDFRDEPRITFHATRDEMQYVDVFDYSLAFHHGHRMRYNGGIGGLTIPAIKAVHRWQTWRDCDYYNFGHFHTSLDLGEIAFNGSVIGPSPYGLSIGAKPEPPRQTFYLIDAKRGKTGQFPVWVAE